MTNSQSEGRNRPAVAETLQSAGVEQNAPFRRKDRASGIDVRSLGIEKLSGEG